MMTKKSNKSNRAMIGVSVSVLAFAAAFGTVQAQDTSPQTGAGDGTGLVPSLYGTDASCTCSGAGKTVSCSGGACSCDFDWQGYPRCSGADTALAIF